MFPPSVLKMPRHDGASFGLLQPVPPPIAALIASLTQGAVIGGSSSYQPKKTGRRVGSKWRDLSSSLRIRSNFTSSKAWGQEGQRLGNAATPWPLRALVP